MKDNLLSTLLLAALAVHCSAYAEGASPAAGYTVTGNAGFTSDYVFNGISQSFRSPALQGGFDYAGASGLYLGTWASSISGNQYTNASLEWDIYAGYNGKVNEDLGYNFGLISVFYPGGKTNPAGPTRKWDTTELILGGTWKGLNIKYAHALTNWYGISGAAGGGFEPVMWLPGDTTAATGPSVADNSAANSGSRGSGYLEANYTHELGDGLTVTGHAGRQRVKNFSGLNYSDYKLAVVKTYAGFNFGLSYTSTNATDNNLYHVAANGDNKKLGEGIIAISAGRTF
jgi:hypothetical protein